MSLPDLSLLLFLGHSFLINSYVFAIFKPVAKETLNHEKYGKRKDSSIVEFVDFFRSIRFKKLPGARSVQRFEFDCIYNKKLHKTLFLFKESTRKFDEGDLMDMLMDENEVLNRICKIQ